MVTLFPLGSKWEWRTVYEEEWQSSQAEKRDKIATLHYNCREEKNHSKTHWCHFLIKLLDFYRGDCRTLSRNIDCYIFKDWIMKCPFVKNAAPLNLRSHRFCYFLKWLSKSTLHEILLVLCRLGRHWLVPKHLCCCLPNELAGELDSPGLSLPSGSMWR